VGGRRHEATRRHMVELPRQSCVIARTERAATARILGTAAEDPRPALDAHRCGAIVEVRRIEARQFRAIDHDGTAAEIRILVEDDARVGRRRGDIRGRRRSGRWRRNDDPRGRNRRNGRGDLAQRRNPVIEAQADSRVFARIELNALALKAGLRADLPLARTDDEGRRGIVESNAVKIGCGSAYRHRLALKIAFRKQRDLACKRAARGEQHCTCKQRTRCAPFSARDTLHDVLHEAPPVRDRPNAADTRFDERCGALVRAHCVCHPRKNLSDEPRPRMTTSRAASGVRVERC